MITPGPEGFLVGRIGLPETWSEFKDLVGVLRTQVVLNMLFASAFGQKSQRADNDDEDMSEEDLDQRG